MSRKKARPLRDQKAKLALLSTKFGWMTANHWCAALDVQSETTIGSWREGNGISEAYKQDIATFLCRRGVDVTVEELQHRNAREFGAKLSLEEYLVDQIIQDLTDDQPPPANADGAGSPAILPDYDITGDYVGVYRCHLTNDQYSPAIAIERFQITWIQSSGRYEFKQVQNFITGASASGALSVVSNRFVANILYPGRRYTDSIYYMLPVSTTQDNRIFYGLYTDITGEPSKEIFATKFMLFSMNNEADFPNRSRAGEELYELLVPFVKNELSERARLVVEPPAYEQKAQMLGAVRDARMALGRETLAP